MSSNWSPVLWWNGRRLFFFRFTRTVCRISQTLLAVASRQGVVSALRRRSLRVCGSRRTGGDALDGFSHDVFSLWRLTQWQREAHFPSRGRGSGGGGRQGLSLLLPQQPVHLLTVLLDGAVHPSVDHGLRQDAVFRGVGGGLRETQAVGGSLGDMGKVYRVLVRMYLPGHAQFGDLSSRHPVGPGRDLRALLTVVELRQFQPPAQQHKHEGLERN